MRQRVIHFAAVTALAAGMAVAQTPATGTQGVPFRHPVFGHQQMMQALNLTTTQRQQADTIFSDARQKAQPIRQEIRQNREALYAAVKANNTSEIDRLSSHQGELQGAALAVRSEAMAKFYAILTPGQRTKWDEIHQQMRQRMEERTRELESESGTPQP
jgi:Spy/CpxP family protein refolding chaperone